MNSPKNSPMQDTNMATAPNKRHLLTGLVAATFTPMASDHSVDISAIPRVTDFVIGQGADGLFVCGSTGESPSLTLQERMAVGDAYVESAQGRAPVVLHVGHNCLADSRTLARHAVSIGADAIAVAPPSYFSPNSVDALVSCLQYIAEAAPDMPLYYYHIPRLSGVDIRAVDLLERADTDLPSFAGVKFSDFQFDDLLCCIRHNEERYNILFGSDEMCLSGLAMGAHGAVGSTYNFLGPHFQRMIAAFDARKMEEARHHQAIATDMIHRLLAFGGHPAIKASMAILGADCGSPRLPLVPLSEQEFKGLRQTLEEATQALRPYGEEPV
jgi:N-acetylneuraminate lyase